MVVRSPGRTGWVTSMVVVVIPGRPKVTQRNGGDDGNGRSVVDGSPDFWADVQPGW